MSGTITQIPAAPVVWPLVALEVSIALAYVLHRRSASAARLATIAGLGLYTAAVLSLTLFPMQVETGVYRNRAPWTEKLSLLPLVNADFRTFFLNVLLLMPLGAAVPLLRRRVTWRTAGVVGFAVSVIIEGAQFVTDVFLSSGRTADINDLIANTAGALIGYAVVTLACRFGSGRELRHRYALWAVRADGVVAG